MNVLFAVWEIDPFHKVGGLGDVAKSLPGALHRLGIDIRTVIPYYRSVNLGKQKKRKVGTEKIDYAGKSETVEIYSVIHPFTGVTVYLLKNKYLEAPLFPDTFAFFDKAIVSIFSKENVHFQPEIIHCNDLHTGLIPLLLKLDKSNIKTVLTIHNLSYQGTGPMEIYKKLDIETLRAGVFRFERTQKTVNFLLEGIIHADMVTTVSPTYAREIMTKANGAGLDDVLKGKEAKVRGILNGIEINWKDNRYTKTPVLSNWMKVKKANKLNLQKKCDLEINHKIPLLAYIGRFDPWQKGIDILEAMLKKEYRGEYQLIILGKGEKRWEDKFSWYARFYPKKIFTRLAFDDKLAHEIYAGADLILVPSKYEPCGLVQMIGMHYGTLPVARKTGGLKDTVNDGVNGFLFEDYSGKALSNAIRKALEVKNNKPKWYGEMVESALTTDFGWSRSAEEYIALYNNILYG